VVQVHATVAHQELSALVFDSVGEPEQLGDTTGHLLIFLKLDLGKHLKFLLKCLVFLGQVKLLDDCVFTAVLHGETS